MIVTADGRRVFVCRWTGEQITDESSARPPQAAPVWMIGDLAWDDDRREWVRARVVGPARD